MNYFCILEVCQVLKETRSHSKVTLRSFQGQNSKKCENIYSLSNLTRLVVQLTITKTDFETLLVRHIFHTHFQEIGGSVSPEGITPLFSLLHSFLNV